MTSDLWLVARRACGRPAWLPGYQVSNRGRVRSRRRRLANGQMHGGQLLAPVADKDGYRRVWIDGHWLGVAALVLETFVGPAPDGTEACHWPVTDRSCNDLSNLRWGTHLENERDKTRQPERLDWIGTHRPVVAGTAVTVGAAGG